MIIELKENKIKDIAKVQMRAWQKGFTGILSKELLSGLRVEKFEKNWRNILETQSERKNFIWLDDLHKGLGFISFGILKDKNETACFEVYGLYVHPGHWRKNIATKLMNFAIELIRQHKPEADIILWTMKENQLSKNFYLKFGFEENGKKRISTRNGEIFEEIQFEI